MAITKGIKIVCKLWLVSGLPVYKHENGKFVNKKSKGFIFPILFLLLNLLFFVRSTDFGPNITNYVDIVQFGAMYLQNIATIYTLYYRKGRIEKLFENIQIFEKHLGKSHRVTTSRKLVIFSVAFYMMMLFQLVAIVGFNTNYIKTACYYSLILYICNFSFPLFFFLQVLRRFHSTFAKAVKTTLTKKVYIVEADFRPIIQSYSLLNKLSRDVHKSFDKPILFNILKNFIFAVTTAFNATYSIMEHSTVLGYLLRILETAVFLIVILSSTFIMAYYFEDISQQDLLMLDLLDEIALSSKGEFALAYKSAELFDLKLKRRRSEFYICGLFPLNRAFMYTMIAGMASYMIYLVQFNQIKLVNN